MCLFLSVLRFLCLILLLLLCFIRRYYCTFHVQEYNINSVAEIESFINATLTSKYENGSVIIQTLTLAIRHIGEIDFLTQIKKERCF